MSDGISNKQFVGVDLHLHRSVICRIDEQGRQVDCVQIDNDPAALVAEVLKAGRGAPVAIEATYGWYWAVKTDARDAHELANLLRLGSLPEAYIAPPDLRELRELVRHRRQLVKTATSAPAREDRPQHRQGRRCPPHARRRVLRPTRRTRPPADRAGVLARCSMSTPNGVTRTG